MERTEPAWSWEVASQTEEVHRLLCISDARHASPEAPAPTRRIETTERHVRAGNVHMLRYEGSAVGMFSLTDTPPYGMEEAVFPQANQPVYLQRLVVSPEWSDRDALIGLRCVRKACEIARERGADAIRAEANPDLQLVRRLLDILGFQQYGPALERGGRRKVFLQRALDDR